jgi:hypothetical protein
LSLCRLISLISVNESNPESNLVLFQSFSEIKEDKAGLQYGEGILLHSFIFPYFLYVPISR